jgi:glutamate dehydrogenase
MAMGCAQVLNGWDDGVKDDVLVRAAKAARHTSTGGSGANPNIDVDLDFLRQFYRHVTTEDLLERDPGDLFGAALSLRVQAECRPGGTATVRIFTPSTDDDGWSCGHTVVEIITDDMPFLIDSVTAELTRSGRSIHFVVHPQFQVNRNSDGQLHGVVTETPGLSDQVVTESWIHYEIDRETDRDRLHQLADSVTSVLRDVREAVEDWPKMRAEAARVSDEFGNAAPPGRATGEASDVQELLSWLADDHFTFIGYCEYVVVHTSSGNSIDPVPGTGLGVLRADHPLLENFRVFAPEVNINAHLGHTLVVTKANVRSTVHRSAYLDYISVASVDSDGRFVGERQFLGLFTSAAYTESVTRVPLIRRKVSTVMERAGFAATRHDGKDLLEILETYPRDELFQISVEELLPTVLAVRHFQERRRLRLFVRYDDYGRFASCLVYLPRDRYTTQARLKIEGILRQAFDADSSDYSTRVSESVLARLHFVCRVQPGLRISRVDEAELETRLVAALRSWGDDLTETLAEAAEGRGIDVKARLWSEHALKIAAAFPEGYKEEFPARVAVADWGRLRDLAAITTDDVQFGDIHDGEPFTVRLYRPLGTAPGTRRFKLYATAPVSLSAVLPLLQRMGVEVTDERPYEIDLEQDRSGWIYDFGLRYDPALDSVGSGMRQLFEEAFCASWTGRAESDGFNGLVMAAGLTWRQIAILRAYARYLRQLGSMFSQNYVEQCLVTHVPISRLLVRLFEARCDPGLAGRTSELVEAITEELGAALDAVASLDEDRILRSFLAVIMATLRTNAFALDAAGRHKDYLSFKINPRDILDLPKPRPRYEIWSYSPRFEGVHLRFGSVARGGLRWSDRREDFRTEVLGLVKAQMVKNAVIVPTGAKGGFVVRRPPKDLTDRDAQLREGIACYQMFIRSLLDLTDNWVKGEVVPPPGVVRYDDDDPYLVVAADKGTASFSDVANEVAASYGFWLGDAFASGGSAGYDHKAMGITARGAWESVRRHFRELGRDVNTQPFTVVGVGDMSGDVFGNGMLLSDQIRLIAAFDHRHIFCDPNPDTHTSVKERRRLFELPRSSWDDYDRSVLSAGGGIFPRSAKSIPINAEMRRALGITADITKLAPSALIQAILTAPVDLLWHGGIGTYVKSSTEANSEVGDKANDGIRVNGADLRCLVIAEGGNLGCTQLGRIEFALRGGRVNTDAIDNSAGVDTSDHEVNVKILLDRAVAAGDLTPKHRNDLLDEMTADVVQLVLHDNYEQNVLLGNAREQALSMLPVHRRFLKHLESRGELDRSLEFLPSDETMAARAAEGEGLTSAEFAVLVAYSKITLGQAILGSDVPDEPWFATVLRSYFPRAIVGRLEDGLASHPLRREIITTMVVNDLVNRGGITFVFRTAEETGASPAEVVRAYTVAREIFGMADYWAAVEGLDYQVTTGTQTVLYLESRRMLDRTVRWILQNRRSMLDVAAEIQHFGPAVAELAPKLKELLRGGERERFDARAARLSAQQIPEDIAVRTAGMLYAFAFLDIVEIAHSADRSVTEVADLYFALSERFEVDSLLTQITSLPRGDRWQSLARSALRYDLYAALAGLTSRVLTVSVDGDTGRRIAAWEKINAAGLARARATLAESATVDEADLAVLAVALRTFRALLGTTGVS